MGDLIRIDDHRSIRPKHATLELPGRILAFRRRSRTIGGMNDDDAVADPMTLACHDDAGHPVDFAAVVAGVFDGTLDADHFSVTLAPSIAPG